MTQIVREFFRDEERASTVLIESVVGLAFVAFAVAAGAIWFLK